MNNSTVQIKSDHCSLTSQIPRIKSPYISLALWVGITYIFQSEICNIKTSLDSQNKLNIVEKATYTLETTKANIFRDDVLCPRLYLHLYAHNFIVKIQCESNKCFKIVTLRHNNFPFKRPHFVRLRLLLVKVFYEKINILPIMVSSNIIEVVFPQM